MKKYIVKYQSIEGEIKDGDMWWDTHYMRPTKVDLFLGVSNLGYAQELQKKGLATKIKLFLCAKPEGLDWEEYCDMSDKTGALPFKVVGSISPDVTWVKDGDVLEHITDCWISNSEIGELDTFKIKGPCGHFH